MRIPNAVRCVDEHFARVPRLQRTIATPCSNQCAIAIVRTAGRDRLQSTLGTGFYNGTLFLRLGKYPRAKRRVHTAREKLFAPNRTPAAAGQSCDVSLRLRHVRNVLITFDAFHLFETISIEHLRLRAARNDQHHIARERVG
uniref:Uncharacterized protein n=1 Tax=Anopheles christyi TaxID=43041 RepID=A0A182K3M8_9DIPT